MQLIVDIEGALIPRLHVVGARDERGRGTPGVRANPIVEPLVRPIGQPRKPAVAGAASRCRARLRHANQVPNRTARLRLTAPSREVRPDTGLEQQPVGHRRRPRRLLNTRERVQIAVGFRRDLSAEKRLRVRIIRFRRLATPIHRGRIRRPRARLLLVPIDVELVARRSLHRQTEAAHRPFPRTARGACAIEIHQPLRGVAGIPVRKNARRRRFAPLASELPEVPQAIFFDRTTNARRVVPRLDVLGRRRQAGGLQLRRVVAPDHPRRESGEVHRAFDGVAPGFRDNLDRRPADFGLAEPPGGREVHFLRVRDVDVVSGHASAVAGRTRIQAINKKTPLVVPATRPAEHRHPGADLDVRGSAARLRGHRGNQQHDGAVRPCAGNGGERIARHRRLPPDALHVDNGGFTGDGDRFLDGADLEFRVHRRGEGSGQLDGLAFERREAGERERQRVGARSQVNDSVLSGSVGGRGADLLDQPRARSFDRHAWQYGTGGIFDVARDRRLRVGQRWNEDEPREHGS